MATVKYKATGRYSLGWTDPLVVFGSAPVKGEGQPIEYDPRMPVFGSRPSDYEIEVDFDGNTDNESATS